MGKERIGIMGGTFDPIHQGHIRMAQCALEDAELDRVLMLPSGNPPHKTGITPALDRYRMVYAACAGMKELEPSRIEIDREGVIFTVDTLSILKEKYPKAELYYIIGADTLMELRNWRAWEKVLTMCRFLVCPRSWHYTREELHAERRRLKELGAHIHMVDMDVIDVSSTGLRQALTAGEAAPLLPVQVQEYAASAGLYGHAPRIPQGPWWLDKLFTELTQKRFSHTLAVAHKARELALRHHLDADKAEIAGLLHDCAKCMPLKDMQSLCRGHRLTADETILESGALMHSIAGAFRAETEYGVSDPEVIEAILCHTTGRPGMSRLAMAVALADSIEPTRAPYPLLEEVRTLADISLEKALLLSMEGTTRYVRKKGYYVHPATQSTIDWLKTLPETQA
ncbi:MAG: nicotinate-nucleotide adenylyltransferase [Clostridia bacterium]|nr:nicotinate-nucleotide adenylyltransferase [Clostridia bacterium]